MAITQRRPLPNLHLFGRFGWNDHQAAPNWIMPDLSICKISIVYTYSWFCKCVMVFFKGWEYQTGNSSVCCGTCQQVACVSADGTQHAVGTTWKADLCTKISCVMRDNGVIEHQNFPWSIHHIFPFSYKWRACEKTAINQPTKMFTITKRLHRRISVAHCIKESLACTTAESIRWKSLTQFHKLQT